MERNSTSFVWYVIRKQNRIRFTLIFAVFKRVRSREEMQSRPTFPRTFFIRCKIFYIAGFFIIIILGLIGSFDVSTRATSSSSSSTVVKTIIGHVDRLDCDTHRGFPCLLHRAIAFLKFPKPFPNTNAL